MQASKAKRAAVRKSQRNTKRTGPDKTQRVCRKVAATATKPVAARADTKIATIIKLLSRDEGATLAQMVAATGWQTHSVRGVMSGTLGKKRGLIITSVKADGVRVYRIKHHIEG